MKIQLDEGYTKETDLITQVTQKLQYAEKIIAQSSSEGFEFDPYDALTDNETMGQMLYRACVQFEAAIDDAIYDFDKAKQDALVKGRKA